jgi:hypothetical protein
MECLEKVQSDLSYEGGLRELGLDTLTERRH